jgi:hypothetical protein
MRDIAEVIYSMGRCHLKVAGFVLATEGDKCRDGNLPEDVFEPIPSEELEHAMIGGHRAKDLPIEMVRFFRGDVWNQNMIKYVANEINRIAASGNL